ncbi:MAG: hypothetical protein IJ050_04435 [Clostridia bacterium]|nr:hypothetical protein [Clostridia bacterium]MBR1531636.1 hypothetical protein [Eubacterium sp.]
MKNIIKELYYGNIEPQARSFENDSFLQKQMSILSTCEQALTEKLTGEEKKTFLTFANASNIVLSESELDRFIVGFRLGAKFAYDTFVSSNAPYQDYLKEEFE